MSNAALAERVARLEDFARDLSEQLGKLGRELAGLRTGFAGGLSNVHARIDGLCKLVEDVQKKLDRVLEDVEPVPRHLAVAPEPLQDFAEISASHMLDEIAHASDLQERVARISMVVGKLRRERAARVDAERDLARWKKLARRVLVVALLAASGTIATAIAGALLHRCGVPAGPVHVEVPA